MKETRLIVFVCLLVASREGSAIIRVSKVGKVFLPNVHDNVLSG